MAVALAVSACGPDGAGGSDGSATAERAVLRLEAEVCGGLHLVEATGVAVAPDLVLTVAHSFDDARSFALIDDDGLRIDGELVHLDSERDLALIRTTEHAPGWLALGGAAESDEVRLITAASSDGVESKPATVLALTTVTLDGIGEREALQLAADIRSGDSGAPVINEADELVGLVFATTRSSDRGWAIAASEIEDALAQPRSDPLSLTCQS